MPAKKDADAEAMADEAVEVNRTYRFRSLTFQIPLKLTVKVFRKISSGDIPAAIDLLLGEEQAEQLWALIDDEPADETLEEFFGGLPYSGNS